MFFFSSKKPKKPISQERNSVARFMLNPEIGNDIKPIKSSLYNFVLLIAQVFAMNGLFPKDHPALNNEQGARLTLKEVLRIAYSSIGFTLQDLPRAALFFAVVAALVLCALIAITGLFMLSTKAAFAATSSSTCDAGIFSPCSSTDLSIQWLDWIFNGGTITGDDSVEKVGATQWIQDALHGSMAFYSNALLVVAGFILLYHLLSMVAETAHTGKPMGRANQIWAPIRLVIAIGMLVPIGDSGLNVAQSIMVQVAKWGCGMASQTWHIFVEGFTSDIDDMLVFPTTAPSGEALVEQAILMQACKMTYNRHMEAFHKITNQGSSALKKYTMGFETDFKYRTPLGKWATASGTMTAPMDVMACGTIQKPDVPSLDLTGLSDSDIFEDLYDAYNTSYISLVESDSVKAVASKVLTLGGTTPLTPGSLPAPEDVTSTAESFQKTLQSNLESSLTLSGLEGLFDVAEEKEQAQGWVTAGSIFHIISRAQGLLSDAVLAALPIATPPKMDFFANKAQNPGRFNPGATTSWMSGSFNYSTLSFNNPARNAASPYAALIQDYTIFARALQGTSPTGPVTSTSSSSTTSTNSSDDAEFNTDAADSVAKLVGWTFDFFIWLLGKTGAIPDTDGSELIFSLSSANPLAELSYIGHANLNTGMFSLVIGSALMFGGEYIKESGVASILELVGWVPGAGVIGKIGSFVAKAAGPLLAGAGLLMVFLGFVFTVTGFMLTFVLPMIPFFRFFFAVMTWVIVVFEAVISMPIFALAHLSPYGEGLPGQMAQKGYGFMLSIFLRPTLLCIGLIAGLLIFDIAITFLNTMFLMAAFSSGGGGFGGLSKLVYSLLYMFLAYICANTAFKAIGHFPDHALNWMSMSGPQNKDLGDPAQLHSFTTAAVTYLAGSRLVELAKKPAQMIKKPPRAEPPPAGNAGESSEDPHERNAREEEQRAGRYNIRSTAAGQRFIRKNPGGNNGGGSGSGGGRRR